MKSLINNIWIKRVLAFIAHSLLICFTFYFLIEGANPYAPPHIILADMLWVFSVLVFYLYKLIMFIYKKVKRYSVGYIIP